MRISNKGWCLPVVLVASVTTAPAAAVDTREVIIRRKRDLAAVPPHVGHVLATPNRTFTFDRAKGHWMVVRDFSRLGVFHDRESYLRHPDNAFVETFYFDFDSASPLDKDWIVSAVVDRISKVKDHKGVSILLLGHADDVGTVAYNMSLSRERAEAGKSCLGGGLVDVPVSVIARGKEDPVSFQNQALNRRVEIVVRGPLAFRKALGAMSAQENARKVLPLGGPVNAAGGQQAQVPRQAPGERTSPRKDKGAALPLGAQDPNRQPTIANQPSARTAQPSATVEALRGTAGAPSGVMEGETNAAASKSQQAGLAGSRDFYRSEQESSGSDGISGRSQSVGTPQRSSQQSFHVARCAGDAAGRGVGDGKPFGNRDPGVRQFHAFVLPVGVGRIHADHRPDHHRLSDAGHVALDFSHRRAVSGSAAEEMEAG
jgi:OOP family OmpA-OmpF porin